MKIVVGLGNPGSRYASTRHNVGFDVIDRLCQGSSVGRFQSKFQSQTAEWREDSERILLVKPETFMNLSGQSISQFVNFYQVDLSNLLVVCDDFNLPLGKLRVRAKGTHGGHNGLRDVQEKLGSTAYPRLRIGVGSPSEVAVDYVLSRFRPAEKPVIEEAEARAVEAVVCWIRQGIEKCMNEFNGD